MTIKALVALLIFPGVLSASATSLPDTTEQSVQVVVDPRIELMGVIQLLNGYMLTSKYDSVYNKMQASIFPLSETIQQ